VLPDIKAPAEELTKTLPFDSFAGTPLRITKKQIKNV
jgi:hypothetical protein